jgi:hypothetical protein
MLSYGTYHLQTLWKSHTENINPQRLPRSQATRFVDYLLTFSSPQLAGANVEAGSDGACDLDLFRPKSNDQWLLREHRDQVTDSGQRNGEQVNPNSARGRTRSVDIRARNQILAVNQARTRNGIICTRRCPVVAALAAPAAHSCPWAHTTSQYPIDRNDSKRNGGILRESDLTRVLRCNFLQDLDATIAAGDASHPMGDNGRALSGTFLGIRCVYSGRVVRAAGSSLQEWGTPGTTIAPTHAGGPRAPGSTSRSNGQSGHEHVDGERAPKCHIPANLCK